MVTLPEFLRDAAGRKFQLGEHDCGLFLADWYCAATGKPDPAIALRGATYGPECLVRHVRRLVLDVGLARTAEPKRGDIALIRILRSRAFGAICAGTRWVLIADERGGVSSVPLNVAHVIAAWSVPDIHCPQAPTQARRSIPESSSQVRD